MSSVEPEIGKKTFAIPNLFSHFSQIFRQQKKYKTVCNVDDAANDFKIRPKQIFTFDVFGE